MKRLLRERRLLNAVLTGLVGAQTLLADATASWAQTPPNPGVPGGFGSPNGMGVGTSPVGPGFNNYVPSAPSRPTSPTRPESWPGSAPKDTAPASSKIPFAPGAATLNTPTGALRLTGTEIIAWVGNAPILAGDLLPIINEGIANRAKASGKKVEDIPAEELDAVRLAELKRHLPTAIDTKLLFAEAKKKIPKDNLPKVEEHANEIFEKNDVKRLLDLYGLKSRGELDRKLHENGTSLEAQKHSFFERGVAMQFLHQSVHEESEITHDHMLAYYRQHIADFETPPRARWEQILIRFSKHDTKEEAYRILAQLGNQLIHGASFAQVAKDHSEDSSSSDGGQHDWTTKGSLVYKPLDEAIFSPRLPVGSLSTIIEDERGFSIIRVLEREGVTREPFKEAQVEIKQKIKKERSDGQFERYVDKLKLKTKIWTIFDAPDAAINIGPNGPAQR